MGLLWRAPRGVGGGGGAPQAALAALLERDRGAALLAADLERVVSLALGAEQALEQRGRGVGPEAAGADAEKPCSACSGGISECRALSGASLAVDTRSSCSRPS